MNIRNHLRGITLPALSLLIGIAFTVSSERVDAVVENNYSMPEPAVLTIDKSLSAKQVEIMKIAAQNYAAFWDTGIESYAGYALADDFIDLNLPEGRKQGVQGPLDASKWFRAVVSDLRCEIEEMILVENKAILRLVFTGHFTGEFGEYQGKGQAISFSAVDIYTIRNGRIKSNWHIEDNDTLMKQLKQ
ncbi:MAG: hypothetical protein A6F70_08820 [Cycloclasticus sp. symbiont of Bathymodiolus heckerae]|nr:MAG: hypothetical protein A6F70_08820 [Cycloclasticus sp. symbiont of Bathymodiolus heckerae]